VSEAGHDRDFPRRAAEHRAVLAGNLGSRLRSATRLPKVRPGQSKDQRTFGPRSPVDQPGSSQEGAARLEATPELVSQDREAGSQAVLRGGTKVDRTPADPSLGAVGAGSNAGPHFLCATCTKIENNRGH